MNSPERVELDELFHPAPTVVLAEEDDGVREHLSDVLAREGYRVVTVEDGLELFDYLKLARAGRLKVPDLIVSDVELKGCQGIDARRRAGALFVNVPIILLAPESVASSTERAGVDDIVEMPVDEDELRDAVALLLA